MQKTTEQDNGPKGGETPFGELLAHFVTRLQEVSENYHGSDYPDTVAKDRMHRVLARHFVWGHDWDWLPSDWGALSTDANAIIGELVERFLVESRACPEFVKTQPGRSRLNLLAQKLWTGDAQGDYGIPDDWNEWVSEDRGPLPESMRPRFVADIRW